MVDVGVVGEAVEPGQERPTLPAVAADRLPGFEKNLLGEVFRLRLAARPEVQVPIHPIDEPVVQLPKSVGIVLDDGAVDEGDDLRGVGPFGCLGRLPSRYRQRGSNWICYGAPRDWSWRARSSGSL